MRALRADVPLGLAGVCFRVTVRQAAAVPKQVEIPFVNDIGTPKLDVILEFIRLWDGMAGRARVIVVGVRRKDKRLYWVHT